MALKQLQLSLQFGDIPYAARHRAALPRHAVTRAIRHALARALLANLGAGSKLALITSRMGSVADNGSGGYYGYRASKAALNMAGAVGNVGDEFSRFPFWAAEFFIHALAEVVHEF